MTTGRINQVATLRGTDASRSLVRKKSATRRGPFGNAASEESRNRWVFCPECGNKPPQTAAPIEKQARPPAGPFARSHFSFELPGWTKEPEDASSESDAQRRREPTDRGLPTKGKADPPKRARARQTSTTCLPQATPWRGRHRRPQPMCKHTGRGAAERTHEIRDDIRLRIAYQNKSNHRAPPEPTKAKAASAPAAGRKRIRPDDGGQHTSIRERGRARKP